jgi:alpha/beta superfamily hydrolase
MPLPLRAGGSASPRRFHLWTRTNTAMPEVIINGPAGRLEGRYNHSKQPHAPIALFLHPHPQQGGTMNNKVVYTLFHAFTRRGFSTLRFNFRGVGRSQGTSDRGEGELSDAAAALDWIQTFNPNASSCWIAGFSFGAWIGMQLLMRRPEIDGFISVAPPANVFDFSFLAPCPASGMIVHGSRDEYVPEAAVARLVGKLSSQKDIRIDYRVVEGANHSFSNNVQDLDRHVDDYLDKVLGPGIAAVAE